MLYKRDLKMFERAKQLSENSDFRVKIGCVVAYKGKIIAEGYNQTKTHPVQAEYDRIRPQIIDGLKNAHSMHAECMALVAARYKDIEWSRAELYIYRPTKDDRKFGLAKPCPSCMKMIRDMGIRTIHYTGKDANYITEDFEN